MFVMVTFHFFIFLYIYLLSIYIYVFNKANNNEIIAMCTCVIAYRGRRTTYGSQLLLRYRS